MKKIVYWIGVYTVCITIHEVAKYLRYEYDNREETQCKRTETKEANKSKGSDSKPLDRIGF